ncbi:hypothetical protein [Streptomyces sp. NPDC007904]|uniref:hypothetical protein n=1 Tax=Streptomyces sp. NPDC007904 TaxID=3364787 RepID=UPI0036E52691
MERSVTPAAVLIRDPRTTSGLRLGLSPPRGSPSSPTSRSDRRATVRPRWPRQP